MTSPKYEDTMPLELPKYEETIAYEPPSVMESGLRGLAHGASLGFSDELTAGARSLFTDVTYDKALAEERSKIAQAKRENPKSFFAGEVASLAVPGLGAAKLAKGGFTVGKAAATGAAIGGLEGLGRTEADKLSKEAAIDAASSAILGGAVGGLGAAGLKGVQIGKTAKRLTAKPKPQNPQSLIKKMENVADKAKAFRTAAATDIVLGTGGAVTAIKAGSKAYKWLNSPAGKMVVKRIRQGKVDPASPRLNSIANSLGVTVPMLLSAAGDE